MGCDEKVAEQIADKAQQPWALILHPFSDLTHISPVVFLSLLKQCYVYGTSKATAKFRALQQQVHLALRNNPQPGPATFVVHCLYVLPFLESYCEGFSHLIVSALRRTLKVKSAPADCLEARDLAARLYLDVVHGIVNHDERILVKILEVYDVKLENIEKAICDSGTENCGLGKGKAVVENYILKSIEAQSHLTAVSMLEQFSLCQTEESFLYKMIESKDFRAAEKWATFMGKSMLCKLVKEYVNMNMLKGAYGIIKRNNLQEEFPDVYQKCKESSLKKLAEKGCWDVAEEQTKYDIQLLEYLVYLAMEAGYSEKVDELCDRYSLEGFVKSKELGVSPPQNQYLQLHEFYIGDVIWVDEVEGLRDATSFIEGCKVVGIDCEWKPNYMKGSKPNKVSIMQLASEKKAFIFDLIKLYDVNPGMLDSCLSRILHSPGILKLDILLVNMSRRTSGDDNTSSAGMVRDAAWNFGESVDGSRQKIKCVFCGKVINGGITRLKEHLGHVKGNVAKCDQVSSEVRRNMEQMLQQMKKNKMEKKRRDIIIEEEITRATLGGDEEYEEEEDFQATLRRSRFEADLEYEQNMYRATHHEYYHEGGSSRQQPSRAMGRSYSLNVRGSQGSYGHVPSSTPSERLATMNVFLEREQQMKKQTKINTGTKAYKSLKGKLRKAWGNWITHNKVQFSAIESPFTKPLMTAIREVGDRVPPPTAYELSEVYLKEQYQSLKEWIGSLSPQWKQWGVTIMCDGWTGPTKMHLINFLIYSKCGTVFHKSVDATHVPSKDADYYFMLMKKVVEEVGPEIVVQVVTDNEAAIKAGGKKLMQEFPHLYWTGCAAHCLDLILADISKKSSIHKILEMAQSITQFIYRYDKVVAIMLQFTNDRQLLRPGITRFATNFIALDSIVKHKNNLRNMWESEQWKRTKYGQMNDDHATKVRDIILQLTEEGRKFWTKANEVLKVQEPLVKVLRLVDGDDKPTMGFLYEAMERAKLAIKDNCRYWGSYWKIIDNRWNFQLHHDLHAAGYFLNPQFAYGNHGNDIREDREVMRGLKKVIQRLEPNIDNQIQAFNELDIYSLKQQDFSDTTAQRAIKFTNPAEWWNIYGDSAPHLKKIAMKVLSATTSSSNCERNWSTFSLMHTKSRNRLKYRKLNLLVYVHYNLRLQIRGFTRKSQAEMEKSYNPINLDYIFREDDVLNPWLEELEDPLLDTRDGNNQTSSWNGLDDDDIDDVDNEVQGGSSSFQAPELGEDPPIQYGVVHHSQATNEPSGASHGSHLSMSDDDNDDDGSGGGGGGGGGVGVGGDTYGYDSIGSYGQSNSAFHGHGDDPLTYSRGRRGDRSSSGRHSAYSDQRFHQFDYGAYQPFESVPPHLMSGHYGRSTSSWSETERYQGQNPYFDYQSSSSSYNNYGNTRIPLVRPQNPHPNDYYYHSNQNQNPEHPSQPDIQDDSSSSSTQYPQFHFSFSNFGTLNIGDVHNDYSVHYRPDQQDDYEDPPRHSVWW